MTEAGPGRREPAGRGETVEGLPALRRVPTATDALVSIDAPEATAWCPYEGTADYYALHLEYQPDEHAVELMSYRDYLQTFRDETIGHEAFAKQVYDDLVELLAPRWLRPPSRRRRATARTRRSGTRPVPSPQNCRTPPEQRRRRSSLPALARLSL